MLGKQFASHLHNRCRPLQVVDVALQGVHLDLQGVHLALKTGESVHECLQLGQDIGIGGGWEVVTKLELVGGSMKPLGGS